MGKLLDQQDAGALFGELDHDKIVADPTSFDGKLKDSFVIRKLREVIGKTPGIFD